MAMLEEGLSGEPVRRLQQELGGLRSIWDTIKSAFK